MTDTELLEYAAKAAGIDNLGWLELSNGIATMSTKSGVWNPLTDDGDALRLAVKLQLDVSCCGDSAFAKSDSQDKYLDEYILDDPYAATRRAITRAAAEIGKAKEQQTKDAAWCIAHNLYGV